MVYYLVYFPFFVFGYFTPSENIDAITNILIFSLSGIFTGVVFGAAFLSVARTLNKNTILRNNMINAAYGLLLFIYLVRLWLHRSLSTLWTCVHVLLLDWHVILYILDFTSAVIVSQDSNLIINQKDCNRAIKVT